MKYFLDIFDDLKGQMAGRDLFLFLDYDGTLTPIVERPEKAVLSKTTLALLKRLAKADSINISIVSGRAIGDVRQKVSLPQMGYIGNHGFEIDAPGAGFKGFDLLHSKEVIEYLKYEINKELMFFKGAFIEDKDISLSVHYRSLNERDASILKLFLGELTHNFLVRQQVRIGQGKKVFEIKPPLDWDKGKAVLWLLDKYRYDDKHQLAVYIGDDLTDEDAFRALKGRGITIKVGDEATAAEYYLKGQKEVIDVLKKLLKLKEEEM